MTTEQDATSEPTTPAPASGPSRRAKISALVLAVLLVVGVTGGILVTNHNVDAPVDAVREYVEAIARGDATTANRLVDPAGFADGVDPDLLTDEVLRSAKQRIEIEDVNLYFDADLSADVVGVQVEYDLGQNRGATVVLRAKRAGTTAAVLHDWRVIDPLLVPVSLGANEPRVDTARFGAATVPVGGMGSGWPQRRFFVYPGVYALRGRDSRYVTAEPKDVVATSTGYDERPANTGGQVVESWLAYRATPELLRAVDSKLTPHLTACFAAVPNVPRDCPAELRLDADYANGARLGRRPVIASIEAYQVDYAGERTEPALRMRAENGRYTYTGADGEPYNTEFTVYARIVVTPEDDLTVTFTSAL